MLPLSKGPNNLDSPKTPSGISRLPPPFPTVRLPNHPPLTPSNNIPICTGSGVCSPSVSSVINCPLVSQAENLIVGTPASSLDWDNFQSTPEFSSRKIPIVSTDYSSLEGIDRFLSEVDTSFNLTHTPPYISEMEAEAGELLDSKLVILCEIEDNPVSNIRPGMESMAEKDVSKILEMRTKFRLDVLKYIVKYKSTDPSLEETWKAHIKEVVDKAISYKNEVAIKLSSFNTLTSYQEKMLALEKEKLEFHKQQATLQSKERESDAAMVKSAGQAKAKSKLTAFRADYDSLVSSINEGYSDVKNMSDQEISDAIQNIAKVEKVVERLVRNFLDYEQLVTVHGEEDSGTLDSVKNENKRVKEWFTREKETLEEEDKVRELFTNSVVVGERLDYPKFSGSDSEDYVKFHEKMLKAFRHNKVAKSEQVEKLRKYLSGYALTLVPQTTESIDKAFETLKSAFGDPSKLLKDRLKKFKSIGHFPLDKKGGKSVFSLQEEWFLNAEGILYDIIQLGKKDEDLAYEAFAESNFHFILRLFPVHMSITMSSISGTRQEKMEALLVKLAEFREESKKLSKIYGDTIPPQGGSIRPRFDASDGRDRRVHGAVPSSSSLFSNKKCRICKQLESDGFGERFYEDHLSTEIIGCPLYIKMSTEERWDLLHKAKLCGRCLDAEVTVGGKTQLFSHFKSCKGPKSGYSCEGESCKYHMWVCKGHRERNSKRMQAHSRKLQEKGLILGLFNIPVTSNTTLNSVTQQTSVENAVSQLIRKEKKKPGCGWINKPPDGSPMFIFTRVKGKKNGANLFFDKGCGTALFRVGIPGVELEGVRVARGKIPIGGVGGIEIFAEEDWIVSLERTDGQRQLVQGLAVKSVTVDFSLIDTSSAVKESKESSSNSWVKNCVVPKNGGGVTDGLIGIQYDPEPVYTLPPGLTFIEANLETIILESMQ